MFDTLILIYSCFDPLLIQFQVMPVVPSIEMDLEIDRVPKNGTECEKLLTKKKPRKRGIIYLSTIPPHMNVAKIREIFSQYGEVKRIYLQSSASKCYKTDYNNILRFILIILQYEVILTIDILLRTW